MGGAPGGWLGPIVAVPLIAKDRSAMNGAQSGAVDISRISPYPSSLLPIPYTYFRWARAGGRGLSAGGYQNV
ncbi:hypothetical protein HDF16_002872 [Granulicella aggregans]|uniref:Uncharacterized protein n=1 Tax=Granulicella aggregans TaxID=474949 RepID=A0A7W8E3M9_9BACT|nr:hypothetical protein [Granulicella aggregans]